MTLREVLCTNFLYFLQNTHQWRRNEQKAHTDLGMLSSLLPSSPCLRAGHVSEGGHGGADRDIGKTLPERPARVHLGARHQRQAGERVGQ